VLVPHEPGTEEESDAYDGQEQEAHDRARFAAAPESRPQRTADEREPQHQADEEEPLPEAADVGVLPALVAEPEVELEVELLHHGEPLAREGTDRDDDQADEQEHDAGALEARLVS